MSTERPIEGVSPIEQTQVAKAIEQAQGSVPPWGAGVEAVRTAGSVEQTVSQFGKIRVDEKGKPFPEDLPSSVRVRQEIKAQADPFNDDQDQTDDVEVGGNLDAFPPGERERILRGRQEKYYEGSWIADRLRKSDDPDEITLAVREFTGMAESVLENARSQLHRLDLVHDQLEDRARSFRNATDSVRNNIIDFKDQGLRAYEAEVYRLKPVVIAGRVVRGLDEIELTQSEKEILERVSNTLPDPTKITITQEAGKDTYMAQIEDDARVNVLRALVKDPELRQILNGTTKQEFKSRLSREQMIKLAETCEGMGKELFTRERIFTASYLYNQAQGVLELLAKLFTDSRYAWIGSSEWKTLVSMSETPGEKISDGDKIDTFMRLYSLIGEGGGQGEYEVNREKNVRTSLAHQPESFKQAIGVVGNEEEFVKELIDVASQNIFNRSPNSSVAFDRIRKWARDKVNGNKDDNNSSTKATENWAWNLFFMWGLATHFDNRRLDSDRKGGQFHAPNGWPSSDDFIKTQWFEAYRKREGEQGFSYGPDATYGRYPNKLTVSFMHSSETIPRSAAVLKDMRTFWELWWNEGKLLRELPWDNIRENAWWRHNLNQYFGGREDKGLYFLLTQSYWEKPKVMNIEFLREFVKILDYTLSPSTITGGEVQKWLGEVPSSERTRAEKLVREYYSKANPREVQEMERRAGKKANQLTLEDFSSGDFNRAFLKPLKQQIEELFLEGVITTTFQNKGRIAGYIEWGVGRPNITQDLSVGIRMALRDLGMGDTRDLGIVDTQIGRDLQRMLNIIRESGFDVNLQRVGENVERFIKHENRVQM